MKRSFHIQWNRPLKKDKHENDRFEEIAGWTLVIIMIIAYTLVSHIVLTTLFG